MTMTFCLSEDRSFEEPGVRLAICSINRFCPDARIVLYRPNPIPELVKWLTKYPNVRLISERPVGATSWNCKPHALLPLLRDGAKEIIWIDSDMILARDCRYLFQGWDEQTFGITEEYRSALNQGTTVRTRGWGLPVGREFPRTLNDSVLRVTPHHIPLLEAWHRLLSDPEYTRWQTKPLAERPPHYWSCMDVLSALLGAEEFAKIPVKLLRTGRDVIHYCSGTSYSLSERLSGLFSRIPPFVHGQGGKPWMVLHDDNVKKKDRSWIYLRWLQEVSPYRYLAMTYRDEIDLPSYWLDYHSTTGRILSVLGCGHFALRGMPLTAAATITKLVRRAGQLFRMR